MTKLGMYLELVRTSEFGSYLVTDVFTAPRYDQGSVPELKRSGKVVVGYRRSTKSRIFGYWVAPDTRPAFAQVFGCQIWVWLVSS